MNYIIFGAGKTGKSALDFLGFQRVDCFADNKLENCVCEGKKVISFSEMLSKPTEQFIIVVASRRYAIEMVRQLEQYKVSNYFVYTESDATDYVHFYPGYFLYRKWRSVSYLEILLEYNISRFHKIAIYGENYFLPYLIAEISFQNSITNIIGIVSETKEFYDRTIGIPYISFDEAVATADCIIINKKRYEDQISQRLSEMTVNPEVVEIYSPEKFEKSFYHPELKKYKDSHIGERCFIIGNGPSLSIDILNILNENNEFSFAFNKIYKIFDRTIWRPNVLGMVDPLILKGSELDIPNLNGTIIVSDEWNRSYEKIFNNVDYYHNFTETYYPYYPNFSDDMTKGMYRGFSVIYNIGLQMAAYMGFTEMYLVGVDHNNFGDVTNPSNHFIRNYYSEDERNLRKDSTDHFYEEEITNAYKKAEIYSRKHGFRIFNATRGGRLEVFERVEFESLF